MRSKPACNGAPEPASDHQPGSELVPPERSERAPRWPAPRRRRAPAAAQRLAGATPVPAADHRPGPSQRRRRAARGRRGGQHHVDRAHQLLHGAWPAPPCSCSGSPAGFSPAPPARCARPLLWPTPRRRRAPVAAWRLAGSTLFLQRLTGRILAGAAGALRAAAAVANTTSTARTSCCMAPDWRHLVPAADHRPGPRKYQDHLPKLPTCKPTRLPPLFRRGCTYLTRNFRLI
ncbi:hypothetical protein JAB4_057850 (plasmid) [Janthinobacterium sp. HH102]|nr:hypothetical protein JAB4_057850 [Janthinobacterium sp. HH102]